jgi:hypothetical protein
MFNKKNILKHSSLDDAYPDISPAKNFVPSWYKEAKRFTTGMVIPNRFPFFPTFKLCSAFSDSFYSGYIMPLAVDLAVEQTEGGPVISWGNQSEIFVEVRDSETNKELPTPVGYSSVHYAWKTQHMFTVPKGYSALVTHPLNRYDLPFLTLSGIVDGEMTLYNGNVPVFFNSTFEGIIPAGTPIMQVILFKTENWKSKKDKKIIQQGRLSERKSMNSATGWYKKNIWKKKTYE